ncbi:MAG: dihydropteroate synthase [Planctomycetes bacterium HGW-Planctomycetes-1]|nr:MAG: dihydropteroate synthase [Planctomycetes bacterium HGW-Planctomycetes-1]
MTKDSDILSWPGGELDFSSGCIVMGILNVTPDSFSDGGDFLDTQKAIARGLEMAERGAAIIDIGAESTRPGSKPVSASEQIKRAIPIIEKLAAKIKIPISIDSKDYEVVKTALDAGAAIINDITALSNERTAKLAAEKKLPVVLMHMRNTPATMQIEPEYKDVVKEVLDYLLQQAAAAQKAGIEKEKIFIDPGIGFGKTLQHNLELLKNLNVFVNSGYRVLLGTSRKRFIGELTAKESPKDRIFGTAAAVAQAVLERVSIVRVHDVAEMADVVKVANNLRK